MFGLLLVLLGIVLAVIDIFVPDSSTPRRGTLLHVAVILIGIGVLVGVGSVAELGD